MINQKRLLLIVLFAIAMILPSNLTLLLAQDADDAASTDIVAVKLDEKLALLEPYLGNWEIDAKWTGGTALWARNEYEIGPGGKFVVAKTFAKDGDGEPYQRYLSVFTWDTEQESIVAHGFQEDGSASVTPMKIEEIDGMQKLTSEFQPKGAPAKIKQHVWTINEKEYGWRVWMGESEEPVMDGIWKKVQ